MNLDFRNWKLQNKLIITFFIFVLLPVILSSFFLYRGYSNSLLEQVGESQVQVVERLNYEIDRTLEELSWITMVFSTNDEFQSVLEQKWDESNQDTNVLKLRNISYNMIYSQAQSNEIQSISLITPQGQGISLSSYGGGVLKGSFDWTKEEWYKDVVRKQGLPLLIPLHDTTKYYSLPNQNLKKITFSAAREVRNIYSGKMMGVLLVDGDTKQIQTVVASVKLPEGGDLAVLDANNRIVSDTFNSKIMASYSDLPKITNGWYVTYDKVPKLVSVKQSAFSNWKVISSIPVSSLLQKTDKIRFIFMWSTSISAALCLFFFLLISRSIVNPIVKLKKLMRKVQTGQFVQYERIRNRDEIGELSESFNKMSSRLKDLIDHEYRMRLQANELKLMALRSKINPHFLYNTLESITMKLVIANDFKTAETISMLGNYFKGMMQDKPDFIRLEEEIESIRFYLKLQSLRFGERFIYDIHLDAKIADVMVPCFILQPIVENSILHGIEGMAKQGILFIDASVDEPFTKLRIVVQDNGIGMKPEKLAQIRQLLSPDYIGSPNQRIGLRNVWERLYLLYQEQIVFEVTSEINQGTTFVIGFPIRKVLHEKEDFNA